jgi:hypothetical protein
VNVSGGLEFLQAAGFQLVFDEADGYSSLTSGLSDDLPNPSCHRVPGVHTAYMSTLRRLSTHQCPLSRNRMNLCRYAAFPEGEDVEQLRSALQALDDAFQLQQPQSPGVNPPIQWSNAASAAANDQAHQAASPAVSAPASQQQAQRQQSHAQPAGPASAAAAEPRDRQTQALLLACCSHQFAPVAGCWALFCLQACCNAALLESAEPLQAEHVRPRGQAESHSGRLDRLHHATMYLTQVLLPDNPAADVSDEVFRRTPAEVKAAYLAARRKQELGQVRLALTCYRAMAGHLHAGLTSEPHHNRLKLDSSSTCLEPFLRTPACDFPNSSVVLAALHAARDLHPRSSNAWCRC